MTDTTLDTEAQKLEQDYKKQVDIKAGLHEIAKDQAKFDLYFRETIDTKQEDPEALLQDL
jgi:hypothetical protein